MSFDVQNGVTGAVNGVEPTQTPEVPEPTTQDKE